MPRQIALLLSIVFHPVFTNLLSFVLLLKLDPYLSTRMHGNAVWFYILYVFITTSVIPMVIVLLRKSMGFTSSIMLTESEDRHVPYIATASCYLFGYYFFREVNAPNMMQAYMLASASIMVVVLIVNFITKISAHATSLGAWFGLLVVLSQQLGIDMRLFLSVAIGISGVVLSARLALKAHTHAQLYSGFIVGATIMWLIMGT